MIQVFEIKNICLIKKRKMKKLLVLKAFVTKKINARRKQSF